jgi:putative peptidoglycan lipid II flippase
MKRIRHLNIIPPTLLLALSAFFSSVLGVIRDHLLAKTFGATSGAGIYNLDTYYAAFRVPDLLYLILIAGAVSATFIPTFTQYKKEGKLKEAWAFASNMLHLMLIAVAVVAVLAFIFAPYLTQLVAAGFEPEAFTLTVKLMRIMLLSPIIFTFSAVFISLQDSFKTFFYRSLAPIFYNLGIVLSIIYFAQDYGVVGVTWGVIVGAVLNVLIQLPSLKLIGFKHLWIFDPKREDTRKALCLMLPRMMTTGMYQLSQVVYTLIVSFLATGSVTILILANNLYSLPLSIIAISFSITSFATFSELATEKTTELFTREIRRVMQQILFLVLPATVGVLLLRNEIISAILLSGKFTMHDALLTSRVLFFMTLSLFTHSLILLMTRGFYAYHDTKTPFYASFSGAVVGVAVAYLLALHSSLGVVGVGVAIAVSNVLVFALLFLFMRKKLGRKIFSLPNVAKMFLASLMMGGAVYLFKWFCRFPETTVLQIVYLVIVALVGALVYFFLTGYLKIPEREMVVRQVRRMK